MALQKSYTVNSDISADYWRVESFNYDKPTKALTVCLGLYSSQESRQAGDKALSFYSMQFNNIDPIEDNPFELIYDTLKTDTTVLPVLVTPEVPEVTDTDPETGEVTIVTPRIPAVYKSFFDDAEDC